MPTGACDGGWYCTGHSVSSRPTDPSTGGRCDVGYYCPNGSADKVDCTPGMYCLVQELVVPSGNCSAGYYCNARSTVPTPTDGTQGWYSYMNDRSLFEFISLDYTFM